MKRAVELLERLDSPISEIAHQVGYQDAANFTRAFKNHFKMLPKDYRQQCRNQGKSEMPRLKAHL